jgi:Na+-transporting NADH:ubiquinone oxidoreductase subunit NqrC
VRKIIILILVVLLAIIAAIFISDLASKGKDKRKVLDSENKLIDNSQRIVAEHFEYEQYLDLLVKLLVNNGIEVKNIDIQKNQLIITYVELERDNFEKLTPTAALILTIAANFIKAKDLAGLDTLVVGYDLGPDNRSALISSVENVLAFSDKKISEDQFRRNLNFQPRS